MTGRLVTQYRLTKVIKRATFDGQCAINREHEIVRGKPIGKCVVRDNPLKDLFGFACHLCVADLQGAD